MRVMSIAVLLMAFSACSKSGGGGPPAVSVFADVENRLYEGNVEDSNGAIYAATLQFFEGGPTTIEIEMRYAIGPDLFVREGYAQFYGNSLACFITLTSGGTAWTCWTIQPSGRLAVRNPIDPPPLPVEDYFFSDFGAPAAAAMLSPEGDGDLLSW